MNIVQEDIATIINEYSPSMDVWSRRNCPACVHMGQPRSDTRGRGNFLFANDGSFVYNCFNCHLKTGWRPGGKIGHKLETLLTSCGASEMDVMRLRQHSRDIFENGDFTIEEDLESRRFVHVNKHALPSDAKKIQDWVLEDNIPSKFMTVIKAISNRNDYLLDLELYWSPSKEYTDFYLIPYYLNEQIVGFSARNIKQFTDVRYLKHVSTNILYNQDLLNDERIKKIFVCEGELDAALMGGVSTGNYFYTDSHIKILNQYREFGKEIIVVPDRDKNGKDTVRQALANGFSVALPDYGTTRSTYGIRYIKDFEEATKHYGRLLSLQILHNSIQSDKFQIELLSNMWF